MSTATPLRSLLPPGPPRTALEAVQGLDLTPMAPEDRPYIAVNMVSTADGKATIAGRAGPIGNRADRELFHALRTTVDAVMVGAGTVRAERYGRMVKDPAGQAARRARGLEAEPQALVVSASLDLSPDLPLLADPLSRPVMLTSSAAEIDAARADVLYLRDPRGGPLDLAELLRRARHELGIRTVLCEGGPRLNSSLLEVDLIDELFLSIAPKLVGGRDGLTIVGGQALGVPADFELSWLLESEGHLFARYRRHRAP